MFGLRSVAGFAVHMRMFAGLLYVGDVRVASLARVVASELDGMRGDFADGGSTIVPILPKALGDNEMAHHQKHQKGENEKPRKPEKMPCILEDTHQDLSTTNVPGGSEVIPM
jgi:hypothetical protein